MKQARSRFVERASAVLLAAFAALPLVTYEAVEEHIYIGVPYLLLLSVIVWTSTAVRCLVTTWVPPLPPLAVPTAAWLLLAAFSIYWAASPSLVPAAVFVDFVLMTAAGAFAMLAAPRRGLAIFLLGAGAAIALALCLAEHFRSPSSYRWWPFYQSSLAGGFAAVALAGSCGVLCSAWLREPADESTAAAPARLSATARVLAVVVAALAAVTLWRTGALTATGAAAAGCVTAFLSLRGTGSRRLALWVPLAALVGGAGLIFFYGAVHGHPSAAIRLLLWEGAGNMLREHPWGGIGYGCFGAGFPAHRPEAYWEALYATAWTPHAHSLYLELGATLGVPGLILATIFVPLALWGGLRRVTLASTAGERAAAAACVGAFVAIAVAAVADLPAEYPLGRFLFFALAGLACSRTAREEVAGGRQIDPLVRCGLLVGVAALLLVQSGFVERNLVRSRIWYRQAAKVEQEASALGKRWLAACTPAAGAPRSGDAAECEQLRRKLREKIEQSMQLFQEAVAVSPFETQWTLRGRLLIAAQSTQLAAIVDQEPARTALLTLGERRCSEVAVKAPDFEDVQLIYAIIQLELGSEDGFEVHLRNYLERRLGWDLRVTTRNQPGPDRTAWLTVLERVPPTEDFFAWVRERIEQVERAEAAAGGPLPGRAQLQAARVAQLFRRKAEGR